MGKKAKTPEDEAQKEVRKQEKAREKRRQELLAGVQAGPDKEEVKKEEVISAVAEEMLKVFATWPEEIQALAGTNPLNKESFIHGIAYVAKGYLFKASQVLRIQTASGLREAEVLASKALGPLHDTIGRLRKTQNTTITAEIERLKAARDKEIKEAERAIRSRYNQLISNASLMTSEALDAALEQKSEVEHTYEVHTQSLKENDELLSSVITDLYHKWDHQELIAPAVDRKTAAVLAVAGVLGAG